MRKIITIILWSMAVVGLAQTPGSRAFSFLHLAADARQAAMGGVNVSLADKDVNFFQSNPALAGDTMNGFVSAGYQFYLADVGSAFFSTAQHLGKAGQILAGVRHIDYGTIRGFDESGMETLDFTSGETALLIGKSHQIGNMRFGATIKGVFSDIAGYRATALLMDLGGIFKHPSRDLTVGLAIRNVGVVLSHYTPDGDADIPFDVQAGVTFKPQYMPLRFSMTGWHLTESGLLSGFDGTGTEDPSTLKNIFSHLSVGAEILLHRNVNVMVGYNYLLRQALRLETGRSPAGISYGFSVLVKPVEIVFSRSAYVAGNAGYSFTLSTNVNQFLKKVKL